MFKDYGNAIESYLPWYDKDNMVFRDLCMALEIGYRHIDNQMEMIDRNLFVDTMSELIPQTLKHLGIDIEDGLSNEEKRKKIQGYLHYLHEQTTEEVVENLCNSLGNGLTSTDLQKSIEVDTYEVYVKFDWSKNQNLDKFYELLNKVLPAHLEYVINLLMQEKLTYKEKSKSYLNPFYITGKNLYKTGQVFKPMYAAKKVTERVSLKNKASNRSSRYTKSGERKGGKR